MEADDPLPAPARPETLSEAVENGAPKQKKSSQWLIWALTSGGFAAFNGVFAKLTTTTQTEGFALSIARLFGFSDGSKFIELLVRATFFGLNLLSNAIMWILFTRALTAATSTTRVSILNTSANFMVTAILGMLIFSEGLPLGWWAGAAMLVAGSVIIGMREEGESGKKSAQEGGIALSDGDAGIGGRSDDANTKPYEDENRDDVKRSDK